MSEDPRPRAYLLGQLSPADRDDFEERLFSDANLLGELEAAESDLFDDAAANKLTEDELNVWNAYVRSNPRLRDRTVFAHAWKQRLFPKRVSLWMLIPNEAITAPVIIFLAAFLFLIQYEPAKRKLPPITIAFQLQPGALRSSEAPRILRIPANANFVRLNFANPGAAATAKLRHIDSGLDTWRGPLNANVPREVFRAGDMIATLISPSGEELADYTFRVELLQ